MASKTYFYVILEGLPPKFLLEGLIHRERLEAGRYLLVFTNEKFFHLHKSTLQKEALVLEKGYTQGEILKLPSGIILKSFGTPDEKTIILRTKGVFGSGFHPTTRLCLQILDSLSPQSFPALDLGAGTGILALSLARKGWPLVLAVEPDSSAIKVLRENIQRNGLDKSIVPLQGDLSSLKGPFSLIVANLYLRILIPEAKTIKKLLLPGGHLILSGFLLSSLPALKRVYADLKLEQECAFGGWGALRFSFYSLNTGQIF